MQRKGNRSTLARITYDEGDTSGAVETMGRALELAMRVSSGIHLVSAHLGMCDLLRRAGDPDRARAQLTQAAAVVPDERWGVVRPLGLGVLRACLGCGVVADAVRALEGDSEAPDLPYIRLLLWEATEDLSHLTAAKRLLDDLLARNPERYHAGMRTSVGAHRRILEARKQPRAR